VETARGAVESAKAAVQSALSGVESARAGVISAEAQIQNARAGVQSALSGVEGAQAGIESAEAAVAAADKELERLEIRAPFGGLLESDTAELGALLQPGGLCATVIQLDPIKLVGFVPETEVDKVAVGAEAAARLASGGEVTGRVVFLSRSADPTTRTFRVEVEVPNPDLAIRDGQTVEIVIRADGRTAHLLPQSSLTLNDEGDLGVRIVESRRAQFVEVAVLRDTDSGIWVSGLPDAAEVIVVGQEFVTDGVPVAPSLREAAQ
jgi:multidrug efflux system membrane fusion protein